QQGPAGTSPWVLSGLDTYYSQGKVGVGTSATAPTRLFEVNPGSAATANTVYMTGANANGAKTLTVENINGKGWAIYGLASATNGGSNDAIGVRGETNSGSGTGVYGKTFSGGQGVLGESTSSSALA